MERAQIIPNDIIQEIINALAHSSEPSADKLDNTGFSQIIKFSTLSSFCLQQVRKHVFARVRLGTPLSYENPRARFETLDSQVDFFLTHKEPSLYIRRLILDMGEPEMKDEAIQARLYDVLLQVANLVAFEVYCNGTLVFGGRMPSWYKLVSPKSARYALQALSCTSGNLSELHLSGVVDFPISDLKLMTNLRHLKLFETSLLNDSGDGIVTRPSKHHRLEDLESLEINDYNRGEFQALRNSLTTRGSDGELLLRFSRLKSLAVEVNEASTLYNVIEILTTQGISHLEELNLVICRATNGGNNDHSEWLNKIILPLNETLRKITTTMSVTTATHDPFGGLCSTLGRMNNNNALTLLVIYVTIQTDCPCTTGNEWIALTETLGRNTQWKSLREVILNVEIADFGRPDDSLQRALEGLRETHLKPLFSMPFTFQYDVEHCLI